MSQTNPHHTSNHSARPASPGIRKSAPRPGTGLALGAALLLTALVAGLCFTFSVAVMPNLAGVDDRTFVLVSQRFNENPVFPLTFTLALVVLGVALAMQAGSARGSAFRWVLAALVLYVVFVLGITGVVHIPLNTEISDAGDPDRIGDLARVREDFEDPWVVWNAVRTLFATAVVAALGRALVLHGRQQREAR